MKINAFSMTCKGSDGCNKAYTESFDTRFDNGQSDETAHFRENRTPHKANDGL